MQLGQGRPQQTAKPDPVSLHAVHQRSSYRVPSNLWAHINLPMQMSVQLLDISLGGARLGRELPCTPGVPIALGLELPGHGPVGIRARVVWVDNGQSGIEFTDVLGERADILRATLLAEDHKHQRSRIHAQQAAAIAA